MSERSKISSEFCEKRLLDLLAITKLGTWDWDLLTNRVVYNAPYAELLGYAVEELPQDVVTWERHVLPQDLPYAEAQINKHISGETSMYEAEFRMVRKDGSIIWAQDRGKVVEFTDDGRPLRLVGILQDVTRLKTTEISLRNNQATLDLAVNVASLGTWDWDIKNDVISYNDEYLHMLGYTQHDITGSIEEWESMNHPDDLPNTINKLDEYISGRCPFYECEIRMKHKNGHYIWTRDVGRIVERDDDGMPVRLIGGHLNIDELKRSQEHLTETLTELEHHKEFLESEVDKRTETLVKVLENVQAMFDANPHVCSIWTDTNEILECNPAALRLYNVNNKDEYAVRFFTKMPETQPNGQCSKLFFAEMFKNAKMDGYAEFEFTHKLSGNCTLVSNIILKHLLHNGEFSIVMYQIDLTKEKEAERRLLEQDRLLWTINNVARDILTFDAEDFNELIQKCAKELCETFGQDRLYIWNNKAGEDGKIKFSQLYEWSPDAPPQQDNPDLKDLPLADDFPFFRKMINENISLSAHVKDLAQSERDLLEPQGILSLIVAPINLKGRSWGFIGLDNCQCEYEFSEMEGNMLSIGGFLLASAIFKNEANKNLMEAHEEAMLSSKAKSNFLANMSHEIRTPMNAISGMTDIILRESRGGAVAEYALEIKNACASLLNIINDILDISKIESGKLEIFEAEYNLGSLLNDVINIVRVRLHDTKLIFVADIDSKLPGVIFGDEIRMKQIFVNLLSNAVKFTNSGFVCLRVWWDDENGASLLRFEVEDTGQGIRKEDQERLFAEFERINTTKNRSIEGTGLGLAITKRLCEMMNGSISVESEPNEGSIFSVKLPQKYVEYIPLAKTDVSEGALIFEPRDLYRRSLEYTLKNMGVKYAVCSQQSALYETMADGGYKYIFTSPLHMEKVRSIIERGKLQIEIIILTNFGESGADSNVKTVFLPPTCMQLAEIFNTSKTPQVTNELKEVTLEKFIAPDASILIVDDMAVNLQVAKGIMEPYMFRIDTACNGLEAVEKVKHNIYDLVFMDHMMPEMDGIDATGAIRALDGDYFKTVPIIALTANAIVGTKEIFLGEGMNDFLAKPIELATLHSILHRWVPAEKQIQTIPIPPSLPDESSLLIEGVDTKLGIAYAGGDKDRYIHILSLYYADGLDKSRKLMQYLNEKNLARFRMDVHSLKSTSASIGASDISVRAQKLEEAAGKGNYGYINANINPFLSQLQSILDHIAPYLKLSETDEYQYVYLSKEVGDIDFLKEQLVTLGSAIEFANILKIESALKNLKQFTWQSDINAELKKIDTHISKFSYDEALYSVQKIQHIIYDGRHM